MPPRLDDSTKRSPISCSTSSSAPALDRLRGIHSPGSCLEFPPSKIMPSPSFDYSKQVRISPLLTWDCPSAYMPHRHKFHRKWNTRNDNYSFSSDESSLEIYCQWPLPKKPNNTHRHQRVNRTNITTEYHKMLILRIPHPFANCATTSWEIAIDQLRSIVDMRFVYNAFNTTFNNFQHRLPHPDHNHPIHHPKTSLAPPAPNVIGAWPAIF